MCNIFSKKANTLISVCIALFIANTVVAQTVEPNRIGVGIIVGEGEIVGLTAYDCTIEDIFVGTSNHSVLEATASRVTNRAWLVDIVANTMPIEGENLYVYIVPTIKDENGVIRTLETIHIFVEVIPNTYYNLLKHDQSTIWAIKNKTIKEEK